MNIETEYEVRNKGPRVPGMVAGKVLWGWQKFPIATFAEAKSFIGLRFVDVRRVLPSNKQIKKLKLPELRALCKTEGLSQVGNTNTLIKRLIGTEVRH